MDGNITAISSSNGIVGGEGSPKTPDSFREIFLKVFPYYRNMGMTYDEFYNMDHELVVAYREAYVMKRERDNEDMWRQGLYVYLAIGKIAPLLVPFAKNPKAEPYLAEPIPMFKKDEEEEKSAVEEKGIAYMTAKMMEINKKFGKKE